MDHLVEALLADRSDPRFKLTSAQAGVLRQNAAGPEIKLKDLSRQLGHKQPNTMSMMLRRIKDRLVEVFEDIEVTKIGGGT
jgi:hypothetical protein